MSGSVSGLGSLLAPLVLLVASGCGSPAPAAPGVTTGSGGTAASGGTGGTGGAGHGGAGGTSPLSVGGSSTGGGSAATGGSTGGAGGSGAGGSGASGGSGGSSAGSGSGAAPPVGGELSSCATPGPRLIRRLSSLQYRNTLVDAFADSATPSPDVPSADVLTDASVMKFRVDADAPVVRDLDAGLLMNYAETVAAWAVTNRLGKLVSCSTNDASCRGQLIKTLGQRLFREPLSDAQVSTYDKLGSGEATFADAATQIIGTMLQSPYLLYRRELGAPSAAEPSTYDLTAYEVASELSYFVTDSAPDAELLAAAADGSLLTQAGLDTQAHRLLATARAKDPVARFASGWFELDGLANKAKDDTVFMLTPDLRQSMLREAQELFASTFKSNGDVKALLTSTTTFADRTLATFYGVSGAPSSDFGPVDLAGTQRAPGMLGQAGFLTAHAQPENSSPVQRGRFVRDRLLCEPIPAMPSNLNTNLAAPGGFTTNRERYTEHDKNPQCAGCHVAFDPVGFAFENFDGFGRYRDQENGVPIDATGTLYGEVDGDIPLDGVGSLIDYLADSDQVRACLVRYWSYYAHGRDNWTDKKCNDDAIRREAAANGYTLYAVFNAVLHAQTFTHRVKDQ
jgi:hypothetical protein